MAKKLGCRIEVIPSLNVVVADGNKVQISNVVKSFTWVIQNTSFSSDIMLMPLGCWGENFCLTLSNEFSPIFLNITLVEEGGTREEMDLSTSLRRRRNNRNAERYDFILINMDIIFWFLRN